MSHKFLAKLAVMMVVVFGAIVLLYPFAFHSEPKSPQEVPPAPSVLSVK